MRRSCEIAASICTRSSLKRRKRSCIRLKASIVTCNSRGPFGGNNGASPLAPSCSTAPASSDNGFVSLRAARMESRIIGTAVKPSHAPKAAWENWVSARRGSGGRAVARIVELSAHGLAVRFEGDEERRGDAERGDDAEPQQHFARQSRDRRPARPQPHLGRDIPFVASVAHDLTSVRTMRTTCCGAPPRRNSAAANSRSTII